MDGIGGNHMRLVVAAGVACLFAGVTLIMNDLIALWWGQAAGVGAPVGHVPVLGIALSVFGLLVALIGEQMRSRAKAAAGAAPAKREKVVLYEHGPDRPY